MPGPPVFADAENRRVFVEFCVYAYQRHEQLDMTESSRRGQILLDMVSRDVLKDVYEAIRLLAPLCHSAESMWDAEWRDKSRKVRDLLVERCQEIGPSPDGRLSGLVLPQLAPGSKSVEQAQEEAWLAAYEVERLVYERAFERAEVTTERVAYGPYGLPLLDLLPIEKVFDLFDPAPEPKR